MKVRAIFGITATATLLALLAGCQPAEEKTAAQNKTVAAQAVTIGLREIPVVDTTSGSIMAEHQVQVASRLMGYIREIRVHEGDAVKAGSLLFSIDPTDIKGQVEQASAGVAQAEAALHDAQADYERFSNLYRDESIPKMQYDKIKLQYNIAQSQANAARAGLATAESQLRYADVRSPIDGIVTQKLANQGDLAAPGRPVLVVEDPARLLVQTAVSNDTYAHLQNGESATVEVGGKLMQARIVRMVAAADAMAHTHLVKLAVPELAGESSGAFAKVHFTVGSRQGISVPATSVLERAGITGVFVLDEAGIARYRMVRKGRELEGEVEIEAGLNPGEKVIVSNTGGIDSGDQISPAGGANE